MYVSEQEFQRWVTKVNLDDLLQVRKYIKGDGMLLDVVVRSFIDRCVTEVGEAMLLDYIDRRLEVDKGRKANNELEDKIYEATKGANILKHVDNAEYDFEELLNFESLGYCYRYVDIVNKGDFEDKLKELNHIYLRESAEYYKALLGCLVKSYLGVMSRDLLVEVLGGSLASKYATIKAKYPDSVAVFNVENSYKLFKSMYFVVSGSLVSYLVSNVDMLVALDKVGN